MKSYIIIVFITLSNYIIAQNSLDTIYANENKNVALFFPEAIRQGITGANNFVFTYNREKEQYFGLLQATPGTESNLLTVTKGGQIYSYILKYREQLSKLNYFITSKESIGNENPKDVEKTPIVQPQNIYENKVPYYQKFSEYLLNSEYKAVATKRKKGIKLQLQKITYNASEVYLVIQIKNTSDIDFEIDYLSVYRTNGNRKRKASYQSLAQNVIYKYKMAYKVKTGQENRFVYVLPKFVLGDDEKLLVELKEMKGSRKLVLRCN